MLTTNKPIDCFYSTRNTIDAIIVLKVQTIKHDFRNEMSTRSLINIVYRSIRHDRQRIPLITLSFFFFYSDNIIVSHLHQNRFMTNFPRITWFWTCWRIPFGNVTAASALVEVKWPRSGEGICGELQFVYTCLYTQSVN